MTESERCPNVIVNFWEWYERHQECAHGPLARCALDKCEETFRRADWDKIRLLVFNLSPRAPMLPKFRCSP